MPQYRKLTLNNVHCVLLFGLINFNLLSFSYILYHVLSLSQIIKFIVHILFNLSVFCPVLAIVLSAHLFPDNLVSVLHSGIQIVKSTMLDWLSLNPSRNANIKAFIFYIIRSISFCF